MSESVTLTRADPRELIQLVKIPENQPRPFGVKVLTLALLQSPVSGMANNTVSVATRNVPWIDIPTPPPITTPSHRDRSAWLQKKWKTGTINGGERGQRTNGKPETQNGGGGVSASRKEGSLRLNQLYGSKKKQAELRHGRRYPVRQWMDGAIRTARASDPRENTNTSNTMHPAFRLGNRYKPVNYVSVYIKICIYPLCRSSNDTVSAFQAAGMVAGTAGLLTHAIVLKGEGSRQAPAMILVYFHMYCLHVERAVQKR